MIKNKSIIKYLFLFMIFVIVFRLLPFFDTSYKLYIVNSGNEQTFSIANITEILTVTLQKHKRYSEANKLSRNLSKLFFMVFLLIPVYFLFLLKKDYIIDLRQKLKNQNIIRFNGSKYKNTDILPAY